MTNFCQTCGGQKGLYFSTLPGCTCTTAAPFYYPIQPKRDLTCVCGAVWEGETMVHAPRKREWFDCTDAQLIDEVRRRGFVIRDAQIEQAERVHAVNTSQERVDETAKGKHEPVAWRWKERINGDFNSWVVTSSEPPPHAIEKHPLYTAPPEREWIGLTEAERVDIIDIEITEPNDDHWALAQSIEAMLKEKNT